MAQQPAAAARPDAPNRAEPSAPSSELVESCRAEVAEEAVALAAPERLFTWFADLGRSEPGAHEPLFTWLARQADRRALGWFIVQEIGMRRGVSDHIALAQLGVPARFKAQLAVGFWEEMGQGVHGAMPDLLLERLAGCLAVDASPVPEAVRIADLGGALARDSRTTWQAIGFLGASELTTAPRAVRLDEGLQRLQLLRRVRAFYARNAHPDRRRERRWVREVVRPAVQWRPELALPIAEGALMRLAAGNRLWERCANELTGSGQAASRPCT